MGNTKVDPAPAVSAAGIRGRQRQRREKDAQYALDHWPLRGYMSICPDIYNWITERQATISFQMLLSFTRYVGEYRQEGLENVIDQASFSEQSD